MRRETLVLFFLSVVVAWIIAAFAVSYFIRRPLPSSGGIYFPARLELPVPLFRQADPLWAHDRLGPTDGTLGAEGCAVASAAMVLAYYGVDTDPGRLNRFVTDIGGYTPQGWIYWEAAAKLAPTRVEHVYEALPSYYLIDRNLLHGNPVIVRLRYPSGITHFVVIVGKEGWDYLIRDPGAGADKGVYALREFGSGIEALRFYRRLNRLPASKPLSRSAFPNTHRLEAAMAKAANAGDMRMPASGTKTPAATGIRAAL